jgi:hypothetical protein
MILAIIVLLFIFFWDLLPLMLHRKKREAALCTILFLIASAALISFAAGIEPPSLMMPYVNLYKKGAAAGLPGFK